MNDHNHKNSKEWKEEKLPNFYLFIFDKPENEERLEKIEDYIARFLDCEELMTFQEEKVGTFWGTREILTPRMIQILKNNFRENGIKGEIWPTSFEEVKMAFEDLGRKPRIKIGKMSFRK